MTKHIFPLLALIFVAQISLAENTVTAPADIPTYYASLNNKSGTNLMATLNTLTNVGFSSLGYDGLWGAYPYSDVYPADSVGKAGKLWDMYGGCEFPTDSKRCGNYNGECDCVNREHSIPKSWWGGGKNNMYSDIFHLVPTDGYVNNRRSNYAFGEVDNATYQYNGCKLGSPKAVSTTKATIYNATTATCSASPVFEPGAQYKGDFARGYLGMIASYYNSSYSITSGDGSSIFEAFKSSHFGLTQYGVVLLLKWHREDPVSQKEIDRNNGIQKTQGNRNPFIDYPYLAEYIWGEHAGEVVDMALLMPSTDPDFIPGVSDGSRNGTTPPEPPTPTVKYGVNWSVNGEIIQTDSVNENQKPTSLPEEPTSCSTESTEFMGWTNAAITGSTDEAPAILYKTVSEFPAVSEDVTYYAVFAHMVEEEATEPQIANETIVFKDKGYTNGVAVTEVEQGYATITFTNAKYYTSGESVRAYGGSTMTVSGPNVTRIELSFGTSDNSNAITTNVGTYTEPIWTGSADAVTFTIGGTSGHRRIASVAVQFNGASGTTATYSRYITTCQETTELIPTLMTQRAAKKVLIGGHLYIQTEEGLFTITGQRVQ